MRRGELRATVRRLLGSLAAYIVVASLSGALASTALSSSPQRFAASGVLPGLVAADVYVRLERRGFNCSGPTRAGGLQDWYCTKDVSWIVSYFVHIVGSDAFHVKLISASVFVYAEGRRPNAFAAPVLSSVATVPYRGADPARASAWVRAYVGTRRQALRIAHARFMVFGNARARFLNISG
jgi:hypothetical protein